MQPSDESLPSEPAAVVLPHYAINLALRVMQLIAGLDSLTLQVFKLGGMWYIVKPDGKVEKLG
jgi:hypothetical protein